ncbi:unnamed protein product [Leptosia nina]|uniref:Partial AB-hydrolase lipase domain-containing protein n=1 Tax=Leptosia nina TaxID=320188 RepID=A0AAV1K1A9_9NEOP
MKILLSFIVISIWLQVSDTSTSVQRAVKNFAGNLCKNVKTTLDNSWTVKKIKEFFNKTIPPIEAKRRQIKKAFFEFIDEVVQPANRYTSTSKLTDDDKTKALKLSITPYGYYIESHTVLTLDGYRLTIHKLTTEMPNAFGVTKSTVLLNHGLFGSSLDWMLLGPENSLPFLLLENGFDVWLANSRGNVFSKRHVSVGLNSSEFWDFTWHEIGLYDLSATLDYVYDRAGEESKIVYIGYSMSGTALFVLLSSLPQYNKMISCAIIFAPLIFMSYTTGILKDFADLYYKLPLTNNFTNDELLINASHYKEVIEKYCGANDILASNPILCLKYGVYDSFDFNYPSDELFDGDSRGSEKNLIHYYQMMRSGLFRKFDYGEENVRIYGSQKPPGYKLNDISVPIYIFTSSGDKVSVPSDINKLINKIPNVKHRIILDKEFSHLFHFGFTLRSFYTRP